MSGETIDVLEAQYQTLTEKVRDIQAQLSDKNRVVNGVRLDDRAYHEWRSRAVWALKHAVDKQNEAKARLKKARRFADPNGQEVRALVRDAWLVLRALSEDTDMTAEELAVRDRLAEWLGLHGEAT